MKNWRVLVYLILLLPLTGCGLIEGEGEIVIPLPSELPEIAQNYISDNFGGYTIQSFEFEDLCLDSISYEVELEDGPGPDLELYFDLQGNFLFTAYDISLAELPQLILELISTDFPGYSIDTDELELYEYPDGSQLYAVELESLSENGDDIELVFSADGSIVCQQNDDDDDDDDDQNGNDSISVDLPEAVLSMIETDYPSYTIVSAEQEDICDDQLVYEVELEDGNGPDIELYYSLDWELLFTATEVGQNALPAEVLDVISTDFATYQIEDIERWEWVDGSISYEVELENDEDEVEIVFMADGSIYCTDNDDDNEGGVDSTYTGLPASVQDFLATNYPTYQVEEVEQEDICDDQLVYELELEDGTGPDLELYFNTDWEFLFAAYEVSDDELTAEVLAAIATNYPGYEIEDEVERWEWADGSISYEVELEHEDDDDLEVVFFADGSVFCID